MKHVSIAIPPEYENIWRAVCDDPSINLHTLALRAIRRDIDGLKSALRDSVGRDKMQIEYYQRWLAENAAKAERPELEQP
jgi:hypothetical protein